MPQSPTIPSFVASLAIAAQVSVGVAGCTPPLQGGGVEVFGNVADRLDALCRFRPGGLSEGLCAAPDAAAPPARVHRVGEGAKVLRGPLAVAKKGDYSLENGLVSFFIDALGTGNGFAESGGNLIDAGDQKAGCDALGQAFVSFGGFQRQAIYERLTSGTGAQGEAWIEVTGHGLSETNVGITTRYTLGAGLRALLIETTVTNTSTEKSGPLDLGDLVEWGAAQRVAPGKEPGFGGDSSTVFVGGVGPAVAYAFLSEDGAPIHAASGGAGSYLGYADNVALSPGEKRRFARYLVVATRGDSTALASELLFLSGGDLGGIEVRAEAPGGAPLSLRRSTVRLVPEEGGDTLTLRSAGGSCDWFDVKRSQGVEPMIAEVPPGRYTLSLEGGGLRSTAEVPVLIEAGRATAIVVPAELPSTIDVRVLEATPAGLVAGPAKIQIFDDVTHLPVEPPHATKDGITSLVVGRGRYRLVASRGPELSLADTTVDIAGGEIKAISLELKRVVDTRGYVGCDLHQHTSHSFDSGTSMTNRVLGNAAEGLDCAVASEHNNVVDPAGIVAALGLAERYRSIAGEELTTDASPRPFGHINLFPLVFDPNAARGGAIVPRGRLASDVLDQVRTASPQAIIQINHPRLGAIGYFERLGLDPATGVGTGEGYDIHFDALEVWNGRGGQDRARVLEDLFTLLRTGHPVTPTANTDTHGVVDQEGGYPRTYIAVKNDDPASLDPSELAESLRQRRDVVLTNGPFLTLSAGETSQGGVLTWPAKGPLVVRVKVEFAPWIDVQELELWAHGALVAHTSVTAAPTALGGLGAEASFVLRRSTDAPTPGAVLVAEDTFIHAVARGTRPLTPVLQGDPAEILPFALTSPLWIDLDGDGQSLGRVTAPRVSAAPLPGAPSLTP